MSLDTSTTRSSEPIVIAGLDGLRERAGTKLGVSDWVDVRQEYVTTFARMTILGTVHGRPRTYDRLCAQPSACKTEECGVASCYPVSPRTEISPLGTRFVTLGTVMCRQVR